MVAPRNPVVGFDPDPEIPGAGYLQFEDGTSLYGDDPSLAANLDATAPPDARVAGPGFAPEVPGPDLTQQGIQSYAEGLGQAPPEAPVRMGQTVPSTPSQEVQGAIEDLEAADQEKARQRYLDTTVAVPYRPGVSREQLQAKAESGVAVPVTESVQAQLGVEDTAEDQEARAEAANEKRLAAQEMSDLKIQGLQNQHYAAELEGNRLQDELRDRRYVDEFAKKRASNMMRISEEAEQAYRNHDINLPPNSTLKDIGLVIAQAFGTWGAIIGRSPNFAAQLIDNAVEREVAQRKLEHEQLGEQSDNAYSKYLQAVGDADIAEAIYRDTQKRFAMVQAERTAADFGITQENAEFRNFMADYEMQRQEQEREIREKAQGKIVRQVQSQVEFERGASGGGRRPMTLKERAQASSYETTIAENRAKQEIARTTTETGMTPEQRSKAADAQSKKDQLYVEGYGTAASLAEAQSVRAAQAEGDTFATSLDRMEKILKKDPSELTRQDIEDYNAGQQAIQMGIAKQGGGVVQEAEWQRAGEQAPLRLPATKAANVATRSIDLGVTSHSRQQQLARINALRKKEADIRRGLIRYSVQGQHPDVPEVGVTEE